MLLLMMTKGQHVKDNTFTKNDETEDEILDTAHRNFRPIFLYRQRVAQRQQANRNRNRN